MNFDGLDLSQLNNAIFQWNTLLNMMSTIEPNMGQIPIPSQSSSGIGGRSESNLMPKMEYFLGNHKDGFGFIETFKVQTASMEEDQRICCFGALCGHEAMGWFNAQNFTSWEGLDNQFKSAWCLVYQPLEAIEKALALRKTESERIRAYISKFENLSVSLLV